MKKVFSISLALMMLTAILHLSVATHYCGGKIETSKVSFSGIPVSCGMESSLEDLSLQGAQLSSNLCDNVVIHFGIDNNYFPTFSVPIDSYQNNNLAFCIPIDLPVNSLAVLQSLYTSVTPAGVLLSTNVDLSDICVFRI